MCASLLQLLAAGLLISIALAWPGGKPVTELPGDRPMGPFTTVRPELVIVVAAQAPKPDAVRPRDNAWAVVATSRSPRIESV